MKEVTTLIMIHMQHNLERINFDEYIHQSFEEFLRQEGNHYITIDGGLFLKKDVEFHPTKIAGRSEKIPQQLWSDVVLRHLYHLSYN
jgi:hypothetical protein